ncbi:MAG: serine hydrolase [bacterium]
MNFSNKDRFISTIFIITLVILVFFLIVLIKNLGMPQNRTTFPAVKSSVFRSDETLGQLSAQSYLSVLLNGSRLTTIAYKNSTTSLPIASLTKLMTALVATEQLNQDKLIQITPEQLTGQSSLNSTVLAVGEKYKVSTLTKLMLIASDNFAAEILTSQFPNNKFVALMNKKSQDLGMTDTYFTNPNGLDNISGPQNTSSAEDLSKLITYIFFEQKGILDLTTIKKTEICSTSNVCQEIRSTDELLSDDTIGSKIIGGKTGTTILAKQNLILMVETTDGQKIVAVILNSDNRFDEMKTLLKSSISAIKATFPMAN